MSGGLCSAGRMVSRVDQMNPLIRVPRFGNSKKIRIDQLQGQSRVRHVDAGQNRRWPGSNTDPFRMYFGICGLSFLLEPSLQPVEPTLNISQRAFQRLKQLQAVWKLEQEEPDSTSNRSKLDVRLNIE